MKPSINRLRSHKYLDQTALTALTNFLNVFKTCLKFLHRDVPPISGRTNFVLALIALVLITVVLNYRKWSRWNNYRSESFSPKFTVCGIDEDLKFQKRSRSEFVKSWHKLHSNPNACLFILSPSFQNPIRNKREIPLFCHFYGRLVNL